MLADRQSPRRVADRILSIQIEPNNHAIVLNFSDEGLRFQALNPVTQSGTIHFSFSDNGQRIDGSGELVWTDSTKKTGGLRFSSLPRASRERIRNWVDQAPTVTGTAAASEPAPLRPIESPFSDVGPLQSSAASTPYVPPPGAPLFQPAGPGFVLMGDAPQGTRYPWDQEMPFPDPPTKFFRGFVTGAIVSTILAAILFFAYGNPTNFLPTTWRAMTDAGPASQSAPTAPPPAAVPPPSGSIEAPAATAPLPDYADDSKANGAAVQTATERPVAEDRVTRARGTLPLIAADSGAVDLALAQRYLRDKTGPAGSAAAAHFLWMAVEKGNVSAEIILADLYARGDGVTKSCDQARVLLRAAAEKGSSVASQELAQLIRKGCL